MVSCYIDFHDGWFWADFGLLSPPKRSKSMKIRLRRFLGLSFVAALGFPAISALLEHLAKFSTPVTSEMLTVTLFLPAQKFFVTQPIHSLISPNQSCPVHD